MPSFRFTTANAKLYAAKGGKARWAGIPRKPKSPPRRADDLRFWAKVTVQPDGCWTWQGTKDSNGYGRFYLYPPHIVPAHKQYATVKAHVWAYLNYFGPVPDGLMLDHRCRCLPCVNPLHLRPVSNRTNVLLGISPPAVNARKTHCIRGHLLANDNLLFHHNGRHCKACKRITDAVKSYHKWPNSRPQMLAKWPTKAERLANNVLPPSVKRWIPSLILLSLITMQKDSLAYACNYQELTASLK